VLGSDTYARHHAYSVVATDTYDRDADSYGTAYAYGYNRDAYGYARHHAYSVVAADADSNTK